MAKLTTDELYQGVYDHAISNYDNGWDSLVECYDKEDIVKAMGKARTVKGAIKKVNSELGITDYADYRADIEATAF